MALGRWTFPTSRKLSTTSSGGHLTSGTTTPTDNETRDSSKSQSRLFRTLTGGFRPSKPKKTEERDELAHLNKPFTPQNLEHQKILNAFEWNFGKRRSSHGSRSSTSGISPSTSRNTSVDHSNIPPTGSDPIETRPRFNSVLVQEPPREDPQQEKQTYRTERN
ncbi:uncharacterized protein F4812DRAFT_50507 [Daldinia caldariorum]|uniref:uncharacterized protein n=1 Tax=Daldinia caldariorum TaxID=326644 RepID=UPI0020088725|nr:uncharacterized protein F4812DRAFT_50507 [Daldinia caldariorum]KAI1467137.1 hypothetical protein F4812DRAFT_50507 [Daldinia caldariorum]